jgi:hypothetical protein
LASGRRGLGQNLRCHPPELFERSDADGEKESRKEAREKEGSQEGCQEENGQEIEEVLQVAPREGIHAR